MRWADSVYILDAEDEVRQAAAIVNERCKEYRRADLELGSVTGNQAGRRALLARLIQQKEALSREDVSLRTRMQELDKLSVAKRHERQSLDVYNLDPKSILASTIRGIEDQLAAINLENLQCRERVEQIRAEKQELDTQLDHLRRGTVPPVEIQELQRSIGPRREEYILSLKALRQRVDRLKQVYDEVAGDPEVRTSIETKNQALPRRRYELGPSPKFHDVVRKLKQHEDWVKAITSSRGGRGASKAASRASRGLPPPF